MNAKYLIIGIIAACGLPAWAEGPAVLGASSPVPVYPLISGSRQPALPVRPQPDVPRVFCRETLRGSGTLAEEQQPEGKARVKAANPDAIQFTISAVATDGRISGSLTFRDPGSELEIRSRALVDYEIVGLTSRRLTFAIGSGEEEETVVVTVGDFGPGNQDMFEIEFGEYLAEGDLASGNIVLRRRGCPPIPDDVTK